MWVQNPGREDPLEEEMATHSNILAWKVSRTEEPGALQSMGLQKHWTHLATKQQQQNTEGKNTYIYMYIDTEYLHPAMNSSLLKQGSLRVSISTKWSCFLNN